MRGGGELRGPGAKCTVPGGGKEADTFHTSGVSRQVLRRPPRPAAQGEGRTEGRGGAGPPRRTRAGGARQPATRAKEARPRRAARAAQGTPEEGPPAQRSGAASAARRKGKGEANAEPNKTRVLLGIEPPRSGLAPGIERAKGASPEGRSLFHLILLALTHALRGGRMGYQTMKICTLTHAEKGRQKPQLMVS